MSQGGHSERLLLLVLYYQSTALCLKVMGRVGLVADVILVSVQVLLVLLRLQSLTTLDSLNRFLEVRLFWKNDNDKESIVLEKFKLFGSVDKLRSNLRILGVFYVVTLCLYDLKDIQPKMLKRVLTGNGVFTLSLCVKQTGSSSSQK